MRRIIFFHAILLTFIGYSCKHIPEVVISEAKVAPSDLVYNPGILQIQAGTIVSPVKPAIVGSHPIYFALATNPLSSGAISINSEGVISTRPDLKEGTYSITVTAGNEAGTTSFSDVFQIIVAPISITFTNHIQPLIINLCSGCHNEDGEKNFGLFNEASGNIDLILYRIQRPLGAPGYMPQDSIPLTHDQINLFKQWKDQGLIE